jgi:hypothetical protein
MQIKDLRLYLRILIKRIYATDMPLELVDTLRIHWHNDQGHRQEMYILRWLHDRVKAGHLLGLVEFVDCTNDSRALADHITKEGLAQGLRWGRV